MHEPSPLALPSFTRRRFLTRLASGVLVAATGLELLGRDAFADTSNARFAEALQATPWLTEGPYYPYNALPLDRDNDLIIVGKHTTPAIGTVTHLAGTITDSKNNPVKNALVEIWQTDAHGVYLAEQGGTSDKNFQGYGRFETDAEGKYRFRTVKPVVYPGRSAPHIHLKITAPGKSTLTTQLFIKGHGGNVRDGVYGSLRSAAEKALVAKEFVPVKDSKIGEVAVLFDIVLGATPQEGEHGNFGPGGGPPRGGRGRRPGGPPPGGPPPWDF